LGATAVAVGLITGLGEAAALLFRLASGPLADRSGHYWRWAMAGYATTALAVPLLGWSNAVWLAAVLIVIERFGKAIRSPAKDALLAHATAQTGRGKGFAVHKALDQFGAVLGPLAVAGAMALFADRYGPSLTLLALPGAACLILLASLRQRAPDPAAYELAVEATPTTATAKPVADPSGPRLPSRFWWLAGFAGISLTGYATFGLIAFHLVDRGLLAAGLVPLLYAGAMAVDAVVAVGMGVAYDRLGAKVLLALPPLCAALPALAFGNTLWLVVMGVLGWGAVMAVQESTLRAVIADVVPAGFRATTFGMFAAVTGGATAVGGTLAGWLYQVSIPALIIVTVVIQLGSLAILAFWLVKERLNQTQ